MRRAKRRSQTIPARSVDPLVRASPRCRPARRRAAPTISSRSAPRPQRRRRKTASRSTRGSAPTSSAGWRRSATSRAARTACSATPRAARSSAGRRRGNIRPATILTSCSTTRCCRATAAAAADRCGGAGPGAERRATGGRRLRDRRRPEAPSRRTARCRRIPPARALIRPAPHSWAASLAARSAGHCDAEHHTRGKRDAVPGTGVGRNRHRGGIARRITSTMTVRYVRYRPLQIYLPGTVHHDAHVACAEEVITSSRIGRRDANTQVEP